MCVHLRYHLKTCVCVCVYEHILRTNLMFRRCMSAPANLAIMVHTKRPSSSSSRHVVVASTEEEEDGIRDKPHEKETGFLSAVVERKSVVVAPGKDASFYEIAQCILDDGCSVETDKHIFLFLFGAIYEMSKTFDRMTEALEELLMKMLVRFIITYTMHVMVDSVHKAIVHAIAT